MMRLETRNYYGIDTLVIPFKISFGIMIAQTILYLIKAIAESVAIAVSTAYFVDSAIQIFENNKPMESIYLSLFFLLATVATISVIGSIIELLDARIEYALERQLLPAIIDIRARLSYKYIEDAQSWELMERVEEEMVETFIDAFHSYGVILRCVVSIVSISVLVILQVWWAVLVIIVCCIPLFLVSLWAGKRNYEARVETRKYERRYSYYSDEVLTAREAVEERTLFGYTDNVTKRYYQDFETSRDMQLRVFLKTVVAMKFTSGSLVFITFLVAFTFIAPLVNGAMSPGLFIGIITALFGMAETLGGQLQDATKNITEAKEYMSDLTTLVHLDSIEGALDLPKDKPIVFESLEFDRVYFKYNNSEEYVLKDLSFTIKAGKSYAFVGSNGAGKTTIIKLVTRLYDDFEGNILLNGKDIREYPISEIKALFSVIYQDFSRYQISMSDNISLGSAAKKIEKEQLLDIINKVGLKTTVEQLAKGIDTPLGRMKKEGLDLSGGQWQKIAIARSILSDAPIKILDEPTAALDPISESQLYQEFEQLMDGKTAIFISHRLGSTKLADEILVIEDGCVIEQGSCQKLLKEQGTYAKMFEAQAGWYE